ncbi:MAG: type II secretion system protein [Candidatus Staskawiczbacteria bacterium]
MNKSKGFTIIELIVVIAIIAVLAGIVLVSMSGYQGKAKDSAILEELHGIAIGVMADNVGSSGLSMTAGDVCTGSTIATDQWNAVKTAAGGGNYACYGSVDKFCACAISLADTKKWICADATGMTKTITAATNAAALTACKSTVCASAGTMVCP